MDFASDVPGKHNGCFLKYFLISEWNLGGCKSLYKEMDKQCLDILIYSPFLKEKLGNHSEFFPWAKSSIGGWMSGKQFL